MSRKTTTRQSILKGKVFGQKSDHTVDACVARAIS